MSDNPLDTLPLLSSFSKYAEKEGLIYDDGSTTDNVRSEFFEKNAGNKTISVGVFYYEDTPLFCAWGYKDDEHCGMHAVMGEHGSWQSPQVGCPIKIAIKNNDGINIGIRIPSLQGDKEIIFSQAMSTHEPDEEIALFNRRYYACTVYICVLQT
jgi:hypothetical protein